MHQEEGVLRSVCQGQAVPRVAEVSEKVPVDDDGHLSNTEGVTTVSSPSWSQQAGRVQDTGEPWPTHLVTQEVCWSERLRR